MKRVSLVAVRHPEHQQLFLHGLRTDTGRWSLPGGHCHDAETPEEGARREFFEETGMTPRDLRLVWEEKSPSTDDPEGVHVHLYESRYDGTMPEPDHDPDKEFVTFKWLDPATHPNLVVAKDSNALVHYVYDQLGLAKNLRKAPAIYPSNEPLAREMTANMFGPRGERYNHLKTNHLPNGLYHHVSEHPGRSLMQIRHTLSASPDPSDQPLAVLHTVQAKHGTQLPSNVNHDVYQVSHSSLLPGAEGKGFGRQLYTAAAMHHGGLASGGDVSPSAHKAWTSMALHPGLSVKLGQRGDDLSVHYMQVRPGADPSVLFPRSKDLAASELYKREKNPAAERESERIKENRLKPENQKPHDFEAAEWTHPNGHPRCIRCGEEEMISGRCKGYDPAIKAAPGLAKGVMRRRAKFQPRRDVDPDEARTVQRWQDYTPTESDYQNNDEDLTSEQIMQQYRSAISRMHPNAMARGLHRLASDTHVRVNPRTGEREFLLHRGMGPDEHSNTVVGGSVTHNTRSSWTPDIEIASNFPSDGQKHEEVTSAWIPQSKITHIPRMYGKIHEANYPDYKAGLGENPYSEEQEIIVGPHDSELADMDKLPQLPKVHSTISGAEPARILHEQRSRRGMGPEISKLNLGPNLKMGKSELAKSLGDWKKQGYHIQHTPPNPARGGPMASAHSVQAKNLAGQVVGHMTAEDLGDGTFQVHIVDVHPKHQRKGIATAMYQTMEHKTGLRAMPDLEAQSQAGRQLWMQPKRPFGKVKPNI